MPGCARLCQAEPGCATSLCSAGTLQTKTRLPPGGQQRCKTRGRRPPNQHAANSPRPQGSPSRQRLIYVFSIVTTSRKGQSWPLHGPSTSLLHKSKPRQRLLVREHERAATDNLQWTVFYSCLLNAEDPLPRQAPAHRFLSARAKARGENRSSAQTVFFLSISHSRKLIRFLKYTRN